MDNNFIKLEPSEAEVFRAAVDLFCAHLAAGGITDQNESALIEKCIGQALRMAQRTDQLVMSDDEMA